MIFSKRFTVAFRLDLKLEFNYGFYHVTAFVTAIWLAILLQLDSFILYDLFPFFVLSNMTITSFYFMAAMILFDKKEGTINNLAVTPLTFREYLTAKILTLALLATTESSVIIFVVFRHFNLNYTLIVVGLFILSIINSLLAFISISGYDSITDFFLPSIGWLSLLSIPILWYIDILRQIELIYYLFPSMGPFSIITSGFRGVSNILIIFSIPMSAVYIIILYHQALLRYNKFIVRGEKL